MEKDNGVRERLSCREREGEWGKIMEIDSATERVNKRKKMRREREKER